ncbi:hypothetical protein GY45DRAFT_1327498 [Cubamyces sp. BRFM 1775]|nr:hypothetical protein GY45DRAFT_1327498 [Cubamyces sp. BRFM 1775]
MHLPNGPKKDSASWAAQAQPLRLSYRPSVLAFDLGRVARCRRLPPFRERGKCSVLGSTSMNGRVRSCERVLSSYPPQKEMKLCEISDRMSLFPLRTMCTRLRLAPLLCPLNVNQAACQGKSRGARAYELGYIKLFHHAHHARRGTESSIRSFERASLGSHLMRPCTRRTGDLCAMELPKCRIMKNVMPYRRYLRLHDNDV